ncbi:SAM binding domain-containing protein containing protein [Apiospora kogelbergensis]|uniref:SAM binding domain-containing protein containing protein n=1 Tax=Apiospora kogelbergensis TaxID=1337665 RepID=A0AAW0Q9F1_9PEZI
MANAAHWSTLAVANFRPESSLSLCKEQDKLEKEDGEKKTGINQRRRAHSVRTVDSSTDNNNRPGHSRTASGSAGSGSRNRPSHDIALSSPDMVSSSRPMAAKTETGQYSGLEHLRVRTPLRLPTSDKRRRQARPGHGQRSALSLDEAGSTLLRTNSSSTASSASTSASTSTSTSVSTPVTTTAPLGRSRAVLRRSASENVDQAIVKRLQNIDAGCCGEGALKTNILSIDSPGAGHGWSSEAIAVFPDPDNANPTSIRNRIIGPTTTPTPTTTTNIVAAGDCDTSNSPHTATTTTRHASAGTAEDAVGGDLSEGRNQGGSGTINSIAALALSLSLPPANQPAPASASPASATNTNRTPVLSNQKSLSLLSETSSSPPSPSCPPSACAVTETRERAASNKRLPPAPIHVDRLGGSQEDLHGGLSTPSHLRREPSHRSDHHRFASLHRSPLNPRYGYDYSLLWDPSKASASHARHSPNKSSPPVTSPLWHSSGPSSAQQQSSSQLPPTPQSPPATGLLPAPPPAASPLPSPSPSPSPSTSSSTKDRHHSQYYSHYANNAGLGTPHTDGSASTPLSPGRVATHHKPKANSPAVTSSPADSKHQNNHLPPTPSLSSSSSSPRSFLFHPFRHATANMTHDEISFKYPPSYRNDSVSSASASATAHSNNTAGLMASSDTLPPSSTEGSISASNVSTSTKPSSTVGPKPLIIRNNRTYIQDPTLTYPLPVDLAELHRQSLRTLLLFQLFGGPITSPAFSAKPPARVLEVGCGTGFWSMMCHRYFAQHGHGSISFTGIDIVPLCGSGLDPNSKPDKDMRWRFIQHDMRRTPWPVEAGEFDLVMVKDMSFATPSGRTYQHFMDEYLRVLRPGGVLEIWDSDHTIRMLRPHAPTNQAKGASADEPADSPSDSDSDSDEEDDSESDAGEEDHVSRYGAYIITANTPLSTPLNPFLVEYNGWLSKALDKCTISSVPCTHTGPSLLQEDGLSDVRSKRMAIPLSEVRWEREGVGGVVTKDGKSYIDSMKGKGKLSDAKSIRGGGKSLTQVQAAVRRTALETVVGMIQALEPVLRESSGKSQDEWDGWAGKMINDLLKEGARAGVNV